MSSIDRGTSAVLVALRAATKDLHTILDSTMPLANPNAGWDDYRDHLQILLMWLSPLELWINDYSDGPQGSKAPAFINRSNLIISDLSEEYLASYSPVYTQKAVWPAMNDASYRWGICYVIEGSQLGGAVLYKRLSKQLAPHPLNYLREGSESVGIRWQVFLQAMESEVTSPEQIVLACKGAVDTFFALLQQFSIWNFSNNE